LKGYDEISCKKGDEVVVMAGKEKGKRGKIIAVDVRKAARHRRGRADDQEAHAQEPEATRRAPSSSAKARSTFPM
jgi:ribosomal protein S4E